MPMPLENMMKDIRDKEKAWKDVNKQELERWNNSVKDSAIEDSIKDLFNHTKDKEWTSEKKEKLDVLLEKAPPLEKSISIYVKEQSAYLKKHLKKEGTDKIVTNEFYLRGNEGNNAGDVNTLESGQYLVIVNVPAGEKVAYMKEGNQSLLLLRRNTTYKLNTVTNVNDESGNSHYIWHTDLVPRDPTENSTHNPDSIQAAKEAAFEKLGEKWVNSLKPKEKAAITAYSGPDYTVINSYLRNNMNLHPEWVQGTSQAELNKMIDELNETIESVDDAIQKAALAEDTVLSRDTGEIEMHKDDGFLKHMFDLDLESESGIKTFGDYLEKARTLVQHNIGTTLIPLAYTSTTIKNKNTFAPHSAIRLEITAPKGTQAPYIASLSQYPSEKEVLLPRESKFKITGASTVQENGFNRLVIKATLDITKDIHTEQTNTGDFHTERQKAKPWGIQKYESWRNGLTTSPEVSDPTTQIKQPEDAAKSEKAALYYYSSINYADINTYLRTGGKGNTPLDKVIEQMDTALQKAETPEMLYVYRRVDERAILEPLLLMAKEQNLNISMEEAKVLQSSVLRDQNQKISDEIVKEIKNVVTKDKGTIPEKAYMSTSLYNASSGLFAKLPILIRLKVPKGTHAAYLGGVAKLDEGELLIARGSDYTINDVEKKTDGAGRDYLQIEATLNKV